MSLPPELRARFHDQVLSRNLLGKQRVEGIVRFIFDPAGIGLVYRPDATHTLADAYRLRTGNCLAFTLIAVALAREAGLVAHGQAIENTLAWERDGEVVYRTDHVYAGVTVHNRRFGMDVSEDAVMMRRVPDPMSDSRLIALYYNNRAAELSTAGQHDEARAHMAVSLKLDPGYATSWSNAGALYVRTGNLAAAEEHYARALALDPRHAPTLSNLVALHQRAGDGAKAAHYRHRLDQVNDDDPFHHFQLATERERQEDHPGAVRHYRRAIALHGTEHRFHFGLARVQLRLGLHGPAQRSLTRAYELSRGDAQHRYLAKLERLRSRGI